MAFKRGLARNVVAVKVVVVLVVVFSLCLLYYMSLDLTIGGPLRGGIWIKGVDWDNSTGQIKVYIRNEPDYRNLTLSQIQIDVNGTLDDKSVIIPQVLLPDQEAEITISETYTIMPKQIKLMVHTTEGNFMSGSWEYFFMKFEMLKLDWDENTGKIKVLVTNANTGSYREVDFGDVYVNGTLDESVVITKKDVPRDWRGQRYDISLSGIYASKPTKILLKIATVGGPSFELESPFTGIVSIWSIGWFESTGEIKFLVNAHSFDEERTITFDAVYVNGTLDESVVITRLYDQIYDIALSGTYMNRPSEITVKVITDFGAFCEVSDDKLTGSDYH